MILFDLRKYRKLILLMIIVIMTGVFLNSTNWFLKLLYPIHYRDLIIKYTTEYELDPFLIAAIIRTESKFNKKAQSIKEARGLMQIAPITGAWASKELGIDNYQEEMLFEPETNIRIGCWYINQLFHEFNGDIKLVLAAYNGGSGNVRKWLGDKKYSADGKTLSDIPFQETKLYVEKVSKSYKIYRALYR
ncbi:MAG: lytic transglycosylase domain-containing protein [Bacillota bacterium]